MLAQQFVDKLEGTGLLHPDIIAELRRQLADTKGRVTVEALAKLLVDNGHLTKFQATKLVAELRDDSPPAAPAKPAPPTTSASELDLAPLEGSAAKPSTDAAKPIVTPDEVEVVEVIEDDVEEVVEVVEEVEAVEVIEEAPEVVDVVATPRKKKSPSPAPAPSIFPTSAPQGVAASDPMSPPPKPKLPAKAKRNPWEDFRILGVGSVLAVLLLLGAALLWWYFRGTADELIEQANKSYEGRSYETAEKFYTDFVERFTADDRLSFAKVRKALSQLRRVAETNADPKEALKTAKLVLPAIAEEPGLQSERGDLTGVLLSIAEKYNSRADAEKETAGKKALMESQKELQTLIDNPQFVGSGQRTQQANRIARIDEERQRIQRDIGREEDLVATITKIQAALEQKDTATSYGLRSELVRKYPQLEINPDLNALIVQAANIQKDLVTKTPLNITSEDPQSPRPTAMLVNSQGSTIDDLQGNLVYVNALGAIYCLDASNGNVLWRQYIGRDVTNQPIRLTDTPDSDTLVTRSPAGIVQRVSGTDGTTVWKATFPSSIIAPTVDNEQIFAALPTGEIASIDGATGSLRWATKLPQPVGVSPGLGVKKPNLYIPGEHSNLYVLSRSSGECKEVLYTGHAVGSIAVPPALLLGHLFVFENPAPDYSVVRVFNTNDEGLELKVAQNPFRLKGNIIVPPQIDGRRLIVITDLGEIAVLDVELASAKEKVSRIATNPASEPSPRPLYSWAKSNELWVCSNRFSRYDVQVSRGQIDRKWIKDDGDAFVGAPQQFGDAIIHVRTVIGTKGIRVSAVKGADGAEIWKTDIGVPVSNLWIADQRLNAVSSQAALYQIPTDKLTESASTIRPLENPGLHDRLLLFTAPLSLPQGKYALFNASKPNQIAYYNPSSSDKQLNLVLQNFAGSEPSGPPTVFANGLLVPLKNGQVVYTEPATGRALSSPFQPPLESGTQTTWVEPAVLEDGKTVIISGSNQKIYRVEITKTMNVLSEADLEQPLRLRLVPMGSQVVGVSASAASDSLVSIATDSLKITTSAPVQGRVTWGPFVAEDRIWLHTEADGLMCFNSALDRQWAIALPPTALMNAPVFADVKAYIVGKEGRIWSVDTANGALNGSIAAGEPLTGTMVLQGDEIYVGGEEGVVLKLDTTVDAQTEEQP
jgi:outer membrane protein assembly factor BamB